MTTGIVLKGVEPSKESDLAIALLRAPIKIACLYRYVTQARASTHKCDNLTYPYEEETTKKIRYLEYNESVDDPISPPTLCHD